MEEWIEVARNGNVCSSCLCSPRPTGGTDDLKVQFFRPAKYWTDALPVGNGRLGAMVWGEPSSELLQLNEDTLWTGQPRDFTDPEVLTVLPQVRKLVREGHFADATAAAKKMADQPTEVYQPLGDIKIDFGDSHTAYDADSYKRDLDLDTATITVKYVAGGVEFTREIFSSHTHQVIATKISANKLGSVGFTVSLDSPLHHKSRTNDQNQIIMQGQCPGKRRPPQNEALVAGQGIKFSAILELQISSDAGIISSFEGKKLKVEGSNWAVLLLAASSSFDGPFTNPADSKKDPVAASLATLNSIKGVSYSELYTSHLADYQQLFHRVSLQISRSQKNVKDSVTYLNSSINFEERPTDNHNLMKNSKASSGNRTFVSAGTDFSQDIPCVERHTNRDGEKISTEDRVKTFAANEDPALVTLLFHYGRYLLISSSRPGTLVSNLQGIWNKNVEPAWDASPHLNINLEMNYWPAVSCNLSECQEPLFDLISNLAVSGAKTSQVNYKTRGWVTHHVTDIWAKSSPSDGDPKWSIWPMGGAWLCTHLWEHYRYSLDKEFLEHKAYPLLRGCALFLLDWLVEGPKGALVTNPSTSPEHEFIAPDGQKASVSYATTMDMAIIREIFLSVVSAAGVLGNNADDLIQKLKVALPKLFQPKIARDGSLLEWEQDFQDPEVQHRHMSHLFGLYPGHSMTLEATPDLCKAAINSLYKRGEDGPGWSTVWKAALWARLRDSEHAYRMVKKLINLVDPAHEQNFEGGLYSNLFTAHPPFQIDANFGYHTPLFSLPVKLIETIVANLLWMRGRFTAAIAEMLVQSDEESLFLLPALPRDKWANGCVSGLRARGHVTVAICWREGKLHRVQLRGNAHNSIRRLHYAAKSVTVRLRNGYVHSFDRDLKGVDSLSHEMPQSSCSII